MFVSVPSGAPMSVRVEAISSTDILVSWQVLLLESKVITETQSGLVKIIVLLSGLSFMPLESDLEKMQMKKHHLHPLPPNITPSPYPQRGKTSQYLESK